MPDEYGVEYGAVNNLPRQLQATTRPALYDKKSWHEVTTVLLSGALYRKVSPLL